MKLCFSHGGPIGGVVSPTVGLSSINSPFPTCMYDWPLVKFSRVGSFLGSFLCPLKAPLNHS